MVLVLDPLAKNDHQFDFKKEYINFNFKVIQLSFIISTFTFSYFLVIFIKLYEIHTINYLWQMQIDKMKTFHKALDHHKKKAL